MINNFPIPQPGQEIDWQAIEASSLQLEIKKMAQTPQNPYWHGEGNVWTHTKLVCQALIELESWQRQTDELRDILFRICSLPCQPLFRSSVDQEQTYLTSSR